ncbi:MAG: glycoside hydrolase family 9 protein, partial [Thermoanaerobaculia bacterium]
MNLLLAAILAAAPIRVDQVGYPADAPKIAIVTADLGDTFVVLRGDTTILEGKQSEPRIDEDSGDRVRHADFSSVTEPGRYELRAGDHRAAITIAEEPYRDILRLTMRAFYGQRCGTAVDLGGGYAHPACHLKSAYHPSSGRSGPRAAPGGWHDAGDYGRYVVSSAIAVGTLLWAWELFPGALRDLDLAIPESGDATPDVLDEVRWNLEWMLSMQDEDGGVWHKETSLEFPPFVEPHEDEAPLFVIGRSSCATADLAAVAAIAARAYRPFDETLAQRSVVAARRAWAWLDEHPNVTFRNPEGVLTGEYGDADCGDERLWAAAELSRTTGDREFQRYFLARAARAVDEVGEASPPSWNDVGPLAAWAYALSAPGDEADESIRRKSREAAARISARIRAHPYAVPHTGDDWVWGSNAVAANYALQLLVADALDPDARYRAAALEVLHYLLGRNPFGTSFVTGAGERPVRHPHHRPSGADDVDAPWPGLLVAGPNRDRQDTVLRALPRGTPMRTYADDQESYASNEVAINWNAPLVFVLAGLAPSSGTPRPKG